MSETPNSAESATDSAATAAASTAAASETSETSETPAGSPAAGANGQPAGEQESTDPGERAFQRAQARRKAAENAENSGAASEQAAGDGDSTQAGSDSETPGEQAAGDGDSTQSGESKTAGEETDDTTSGSEDGSDSTVTAPENWPQELRERFDQLPKEGEARQIVRDVAKNLQAGFTKASQTLAQERKDLGGLVELNNRFQSDPKAVIEDLAKKGGVEVYFERPAPAGDIPEFENAQDMAKWVQEEVTRQTQEAERQKQEQTRQAEAERDAERAIREEIDHAKKNHSDWSSIQADVFAKLRESPGLTVNDAVELARLPKVKGELDRLRKVEQEHEQLKAERERDKKLATAPHQGRSGEAREPDDSHLDPGERAYNRAAKKRGGASLSA